MRLNKGEDRATDLVNFASHYWIIGQDEYAYECLEESLEILRSWVRITNFSTEINSKDSTNTNKYKNYEYEDTDENIRNIMSLVIWLNNKAVLEMKNGKFIKHL